MNFLNFFGASYRTTIMGLATIFMAIGAAAKAQFDGDPSTNIDIPTTLATLTAGIGLMKARDNKVSSEAAGIK